MATHPNGILDCIIVGGGQAGLAASYACKQRGLSHVVLEAHSAVGQSWRQRYDSLQIFTPRRLSALDGMAMSGDPDGYPTKDEVADYLAKYVARYDLPVRLDQLVRQIWYDAHASVRFVVATKGGHEWQSPSLIMATGPFQVPFIPEIAKLLPNSITQIHSAAYTNPSVIKGDRVLVVGGGNSGAQITQELTEADKQVTIAVARPLKFLSLTVFGKSIFWWAETFGFLYAPPQTMRGRLVQKNADPIIGLDLKQLLATGRVAQSQRSSALNITKLSLRTAPGSYMTP